MLADIMPLLQVRQLRLREVKCPTPGHTAWTHVRASEGKHCLRVCLPFSIIPAACKRSKKTSAANISRFVTSNSPGRGENYHIWGQFTSNYHAPANSCRLEQEAGCTDTITFVHTIMKTHAWASTFSHKYGHYDLVGIAC